MRKSEIVYILCMVVFYTVVVLMILRNRKEIRYKIPDPAKIEILNKSATDYMKGFLAARGEQTVRHDEVVDQAKQIIEESNDRKMADFRYPIAQRFLMLNGIKRKKVVKSCKKEVWVKEKR